MLLTTAIIIDGREWKDNSCEREDVDTFRGHMGPTVEKQCTEKDNIGGARMMHVGFSTTAETL